MTMGAWAAAVTAMKMAGENGVEVTAWATVMTETVTASVDGVGGNGAGDDDTGGESGAGRQDGSEGG